MDFRVTLKDVKFLSSWTTISFSVRVLLRYCGYGPMTGTCEDGKEPSGTMNGGVPSHPVHAVCWVNVITALGRLATESSGQAAGNWRCESLLHSVWAEPGFQALRGASLHAHTWRRGIHHWARLSPDTLHYCSRGETWGQNTFLLLTVSRI
jgi:hypothetical protein